MKLRIICTASSLDCAVFRLEPILNTRLISPATFEKVNALPSFLFFVLLPLPRRSLGGFCWWCWDQAEPWVSGPDGLDVLGKFVFGFSVGQAAGARAGGGGTTEAAGDAGTSGLECTTGGAARVVLDAGAFFGGAGKRWQPL